MATEASTLRERKLAVPAQLQGIAPEVLNLLLPDVSVSVDQAATHCHGVTFTVTYRPSLVSRQTGTRSVWVRIVDKISGAPTTVGEALLLVPATGGSTTASIEWPLPPDADWHPDWTNEFTVVADPDNLIPERNEGNNSVTVLGTCVG